MTMKLKNGRANIAHMKIFRHHWNAQCAWVKSRYWMKIYFGELKCFGSHCNFFEVYFFFFFCIYVKLTSFHNHIVNCSRLCWQWKNRGTQVFEVKCDFCWFRYSLSPSQQVSCSNIVESSSLNLSQSNLTACGSSNNQESPSKWSCSACTFVNSMKCSRCAQCTAKRETDSDSSSHVQEQINALSIKDVDPELTAVNNRTSPLRSNSLSGSRTNLGAAGNRISPVDNKCYSTKWPCSVGAPTILIMFTVCHHFVVSMSI